MAMRPVSSVSPRPLVRPASLPVRAAATPAPAPAKPGLVKRVEADAIHGLHTLLVHSPLLNRLLAPIAGPFVKHKFNAPAKPGAPTGPAPLSADTVEQARALMAANFHPEQGKVLVAISGGGAETVHAFVVTGVTPDGHVKITQAIAQTSDKPEQYKGLGGWISKLLDKKLGNAPYQMKGVVTEDWNEYAVRSKRNSFVLMELDTTPEKAQQALKDLQAKVGQSYDKTLLGNDPATKATNQQLYCTEVAASFVNEIKPGTIKQSEVGGYPVFQVADIMRASDVNGGPLKVLLNGENRLDIAKASPFPQG